MFTPQRTVRGLIRYTSAAPERQGRERGREWFAITVQSDGTRTLQAHSEIDDLPPVVRDVTLSLGADWKPSDAFVRLTVDARFVGSSWFRFGEHCLECEGYTAREGRLSQRCDVARPIELFGAHPLSADAWLTNVVKLDQGETSRFVEDAYVCSLDHRGATGPMLVRHPLGLRFVFTGRERLQVAAGEFDALHFHIGEGAGPPSAQTGNEPGKLPPYELWCTADGDYVFLKAVITGYMMTSYELVSLERT